MLPDYVVEGKENERTLSTENLANENRPIKAQVFEEARPSRDQGHVFMIMKMFVLHNIHQSPLSFVRTLLYINSSLSTKLHAIVMLYCYATMCYSNRLTRIVYLVSPGERSASTALTVSAQEPTSSIWKGKIMVW